MSLRVCLQAAIPTLLLGCTAPGFVDVYGGAAFPSDGDQTIDGTSGEVNFDDGFSAGGRGGAYFDVGWWVEPGVALDVGVTEFDTARDTDFTTVSITPLLMVRGKLGRSTTYPDGVLQPYGAIGPGIFITHQDSDFAGLAGSLGLSGSLDSTSVSLGPDLRVGVAGPLWHRSLAAFVEYRLTHQSPDFDGQVAGLPFSIKVDWFTHHLLFGLSYRF